MLMDKCLGKTLSHMMFQQNEAVAFQAVIEQCNPLVCNMLYCTFGETFGETSYRKEGYRHAGRNVKSLKVRDIPRLVKTFNRRKYGKC